MQKNIKINVQQCKPWFYKRFYTDFIQLNWSNMIYIHDHIIYIQTDWFHGIGHHKYRLLSGSVWIVYKSLSYGMIDYTVAH